MSEDLDNGNPHAVEELRSIVSRLESIAEERRTLGEDFNDVLTEAGSAGFDKKAIRQVLRIRAQDRAERESQEELVAIYLRSLG